MRRRRFLQLSAAGLATVAASACAAPTPGMPGTAPGPTAAGTLPTQALTAVATGNVPVGTPMGNENVPGFYVRYFRSLKALDPAAWRLTVKGLVAAPMTLSLEQILAELPRVAQNTRMKCVEGWSSRAGWGGFTYDALAGLVKPKATAEYVRFECADGYWEVLPLAELQRPGALFVTHMNDALLPAKYGAPLRMIFPWLYGYKGAKAVTTVDFRAEWGKGYWSTGGNYSVEGVIEAGVDFPLDLDSLPRVVTGGEVTEY